MLAAKYTPQLLNILRSKAIAYANQRISFYSDLKHFEKPGVKEQVRHNLIDYKFAELLAKEAIKASKNYSRN
jgi:hypothetical protein